MTKFFNTQTVGKVLYGVIGMVAIGGFVLTAPGVLGNNEALAEMCMVSVIEQQIAYNRCN